MQAFLSRFLIKHAFLQFLAVFLSPCSTNALKQPPPPPPAPIIYSYLDQRASAALDSQRAFLFLETKITSMRSGISLGPISGDVTHQSVCLWAKSVVPGQVRTRTRERRACMHTHLHSSNQMHRYTHSWQIQIDSS